MHRALTAIFLVALMLGYALPQFAASETICLYTFEACELAKEDQCACEFDVTHCSEDSHGDPCCLDVGEGSDFFVTETVRLLSGPDFLEAVFFAEIPDAKDRSASSDLSLAPAPPPPPSERFHFLECERILV